MLGRLAGEEEFDLVVVGGGATGSGVALDAATRGLKVAMVERDDWGAGTSARSTKLLWAGSRYLVQALVKLFSPASLLAPRSSIAAFASEFKMVLNCHRERTFLLQKQEHLTHWVPIAVPMDRWLLWPPPFNYPPALLGPFGLFYAFFKFYDALSGFQVPPSHIMTKERTLRKFPQLDDKVKYCCVFYEGQHNDSRTNVAIALTAAEKGAAVANYAEVTEVLRENENNSGRVTGVRVVDRAPGGGGGKVFDVRGKVVMFCGGPFTDELRNIEAQEEEEVSSGSSGGGGGSGKSKSKTKLERAVMGASGIHVVLPGFYAPKGIGMVDMATSDGRFLFFLPWLGHTVVGTTDTPCEEPSMRPVPSEAEISWVINEVG